jgi:polyisoprenoid-binding protein YceI
MNRLLLLAATLVATTSLRAQTVTYEVTDASEIGFTGHKDIPLVGKGTKDGQFLTFEGTLTLTNNDLATLTLQGKVDMASLTTDSEKLTEALSSDAFFSSNKHAEATFASKAVKKTEKGVEVTGDLSIKGKPVSITFPAEVAVQGDTLTVSAAFPVNRQNWGIQYKGIFFKDGNIQDQADLKWKLVAKKKAS